MCENVCVITERGRGKSAVRIRLAARLALRATRLKSAAAGVCR